MGRQRIARQEQVRDGFERWRGGRADGSGATSATREESLELIESGQLGSSEGEVARWIAAFVADGPGTLPGLVERIVVAGVERAASSRQVA